MKKLVSLILLLSSFLLSNESVFSNSTLSTLSSEDKMSYVNALEYFKKRDFKKSYTLFDELFFNNMDNILINYYLGRSAYEIKDYEMALSAYDRILIQDSQNQRVRLELAQTYLAMKLLVQAKKEYETVLLNDIPLTVRDRIKMNLEYISNLEKKHFFNAAMFLNIIYDSNIDATPDAGEFTIYNSVFDNNITLENDGNKNSTMIYQAVALFNHKYKFNNSLFLDNTFSAVAMKYNNYKEKDLNIFSFATRPTYFYKKHKMTLGFGFDRILKGHENYLSDYFIDTSYTNALSPKLISTVSFKYLDTSYSSEDDKDKRTYEFYNSYKYLTPSFGTFSLKLSLGKEKEKENLRTDISNDYYGVSLFNKYELLNDYSLLSNFSYKKTSYKDKDVNFLTKREDSKKSYGLTLEKEVTDKITFSLGGTYIKNNSNHEVSSYDKYLLNASLFINF